MGVRQIRHSATQQRSSEWNQGVRGRAMYRGYQVNVECAEAFEVVKAVDVYFKEWNHRTRDRAEARHQPGAAS